VARGRYAHVAVGVDVGHDLVGGIGQRPPGGMNVLEKIEILEAVHRGQRRDTVVVGRDHLVVRVLRGGEQQHTSARSGRSGQRWTRPRTRNVCGSCASWRLSNTIFTAPPLHHRALPNSVTGIKGVTP
jgi:hypothetical protein